MSCLGVHSTFGISGIEVSSVSDPNLLLSGSAPAESLNRLGLSELSFCKESITAWLAST
jgi:hypothetical protein